MSNAVILVEIITEDMTMEFFIIMFIAYLYFSEAASQKEHQNRLRDCEIKALNQCSESLLKEDDHEPAPYPFDKG